VTVNTIIINYSRQHYLSLYRTVTTQRQYITQVSIFSFTFLYLQVHRGWLWLSTMRTCLVTSPFSYVCLLSAFHRQKTISPQIPLMQGHKTNPELCMSAQSKHLTVCFGAKLWWQCHQRDERDVYGCRQCSWLMCFWIGYITRAVELACCWRGCPWYAAMLKSG